MLGLYRSHTLAENSSLIKGKNQRPISYYVYGRDKNENYVLGTRQIKLIKNYIKSVAYSSQGSHTGQLEFGNWLADENTKQ